MDRLKRKSFLKYELKKQLLTAVKKSKTVPYLRRYRGAFYLSNIPTSMSKVVVNNRCVSTGRNLGVNGKTGYSRFVLRDESYKSNLPGFRRASW